MNPCASGAAFLDSGAFCCPPVSIMVELLLRSCPCTLLHSLAVERSQRGSGASGASGTLPSAAGFAFCSAGWQSWQFVGVGKCPSQGCVRAGGRWGSRLGPGCSGSPACWAPGPPPAAGRGQTSLCAAGPAEPVEPELPGSSPAAAPHPGQPVCPPACREGGSRESRVPQQHPGAACRVLPAAGRAEAPAGLGSGAGSHCSREPALVVRVGW